MRGSRHAACHSAEGWARGQGRREGKRDPGEARPPCTLRRPGSRPHRTSGCGARWSPRGARGERRVSEQAGAEGGYTPLHASPCAKWAGPRGREEAFYGRRRRDCTEPSTVFRSLRSAGWLSCTSERVLHGTRADFLHDSARAAWLWRPVTFNSFSCDEDERRQGWVQAQVKHRAERLVDGASEIFPIVAVVDERCERKRADGDRCSVADGAPDRHIGNRTPPQVPVFLRLPCWWVGGCH